VIEPTSTIVAAEEADYILGVAKLETKLVILLDIGRLLVGGEKRMPTGGETARRRATAESPVS
jgi:chemotaxis signal transduction protein